MRLDRVRTLRLVVVIVDPNVGARHINRCDVAFWPLTSFTALQKGGRYRINSGQTAPSGLTSSAAFDESPGGISPPGAPRTVHDPLESHGSRCSAVAMT